MQEQVWDFQEKNPKINAEQQKINRLPELRLYWLYQRRKLKSFKIVKEQRTWEPFEKGMWKR